MTETAEATAVAEQKKPQTLELEHLKLIQEEKIEVKDLPKEIKAKMNTLNMMVQRYKKSGNESLLPSIKKQDVVIANAIQDHLEKDIPQETEDQKKQREEAEAKAKKDADDKAAADAQAAKDAEEKEAKKKENPDYEKEESIRAALKDGKIGTAELKKLLGRTPSTFKSVEKIGKLTLKKIWLQEIWQEQK